MPSRLSSISGPWATLLLGATMAAASAAAGTASEPELADLESLAQLGQVFDAGVEHPRLVLLLSPT